MNGGERKLSTGGMLGAAATCASLWLKTSLGWKRLAWLLPIVAFPVGLGAWQVLSGTETPARFFRQIYVNLYLQLLSLGLPLFLAISAVRDELDDGTAAYVLARPVRREVVFTSKLAGALLLSAFCLTASLLVAWVIVFFAADTSAFAQQVRRLPLQASVLLVAAAAYTGIFGLAGMLLPRPLVLSLLYALGWEVVCSNLPGGIPRFTLMYYLKSLLGLRPEAGGVLGLLLPPLEPASFGVAMAVPLTTFAIAMAGCALVAAIREFRL